MMNQADLLFCILCAGLLSSIFSLIFAERITQYFGYLIGGGIGFFAGLFIGSLIDLDLVLIGEIKIVYGVIGCIIFLMVTRTIQQSVS